MWNIIIVALLVILSGLFSGLTLGLMGLSPHRLKRKVLLGNVHAKKIYPLRKQGNLLLCTLLLGNVAVNAAISILLGSVTAGIIAGVVATGLIVIFGEILPQAFFSRHGLVYGAKMTAIVWVFLVILYPLTKPIAMLLDKALGGETPSAISKEEVQLLMNEQQKLKTSEIDKEDYEIVSNVLEFSEHTVRSVMTPIKNAFFLNKNQLLDEKVLCSIHDRGHSRVPVFERTKQNIVGILFAKDLITIDPDDKKAVGEVMRKRVFFITPSEKLDEVLKKFRRARIHIGVVRNHKGKVRGIVTVEDILEEIIGELVDEHDRHIDMREPK